MDFKRHIIEMLGLQDVIIEDFKRSKRNLSIEVKVRQKRSECFCKHCGQQFGSIKEWSLKKLLAPPMGVYQKVVVKFFQLRGYCEDCTRSSVAEVDWIHPKFDNMTCGFAEKAGRLMEEITCEGVSRILLADSKLMWRLDQHRMEVMLQFLKLPPDTDLTYLAADEVHFRSIKNVLRKGLVAKRYTPQFVTNLVAPKSGKVLFNALGRDSGALKSALSILSEGQKLAVENFALDMHDGFISVAKAECENAQICVDRFHLAQKVNEAFDKVRRSEFKKAKENKDNLSQNMLEPHRRFILMAREKELSKSEQKLLDKLRKHNESIHVAMLLIEYFHKALDKKSIKAFRTILKTWYQLVRESKLEPFRKFAALIRKYRTNIEAYIESRLTTAVAEGLNNKIKVLKRMGYGYSNPISFCRKILQRCGFLNHLSINTDEFFFKWPNPA
ncbi:MAG: ISL3 family transposase [Bdellovibrionales bacterium]|nr:ISL3 family transposase [Bdellovibrionales bacterium]